jgi:methylmalonyl-CoA epimerase
VIPIKRIDHISMGHHDYRGQLAHLERLLGFKRLYDFPAREGSDFSGGTSQVRGTEIEFEVIEPSHPKSFVQRFLDEQGPGLHHIAVETHSIEETVAELERLDITPFGGIADDGAWLFTFIHPKESGGVLWQPYVPKGPPRELDRTAGSGVVGLIRVDHVSMATKDIEWQIEFQSKVFGCEVEARWEDEELGYLGAVMTIPGSLLRFEMMQPSRPDSHVQKFIDTRRPGLHHVCCEVADVEAAVAALKEEGIEAHGGVIENDWRKHTFIHPRDSGGVLFQLFEEPKGQD